MIPLDYWKGLKRPGNRHQFNLSTVEEEVLNDFSGQVLWSMKILTTRLQSALS